MKNFQLSLAAFLLTSLAAWGAPLSPEEALGQAVMQIRSDGNIGLRTKSAIEKDFKLVHTAKSSSTGTNLYYVFNRDEDRGFLLVGADDRIPEVIGYSERGHFDADAMPENMRSMMESWSDQAEWLVTHPEAKRAKVIKPRQAVEPLLGDIQWDQNDPYNKLCPNVTQYSAYGEKLSTKAPAATGCVATALSQVMYYHRWPEQGHGSVRYQSDNGDDVINISVNYEGESFDWDSMESKITKKSSANAISAVSRLMYYVGTSVESVYGMGTGATSIAIAPALKEYWGYDKGLRYLIRDFHTEADWNYILQEELIARRPVPYGGVTRKKAGHFFVLDGMDERGYYHVNWGWSGEGNGYYRLELLLSENPGLGSVNDGFHYQQNMVVGIQKPTGQEAEEQICFTAEMLENFDETISRQGSAIIKAHGVWNNSATSATAKLGFALFDAEGNVLKEVIAVNTDSYDPAYGVNTMEAGFEFPSEIPVGTYTIRPIYQLDRENYGVNHVIRLPQGRADRYTVTVTDKNIKVAAAGKFKLNIKGVYDENGQPVGPKSKKLIIDIDNTGTEFQGRAQIRCYIEGKFYTVGPTNINGIGDQYNFISIQAGEHELVFDNTYGLPASDRYIFEIDGCEGRWDLNQKLGKLEILASLSNVRVDGSALSPALKLADDVEITSMTDNVLPCNDIRARALIHNDGGAFEGNLSFLVTSTDEAESEIGYITFDPVVIERESEQWINLENGTLPEGCVIGRKYDLTICWDGMGMSPTYHATVENVTIGEPIEKEGRLRIMDLSLDPEVLTPGQTNKLTFEVGNNLFPFDDNVSFTLSLNGEEAFRSTEKPFKIEGNQYDFIEFEEILPHSLANSDNYEVSLLDGKGRVMDSVNGVKLIGMLGGMKYTEDEQYVNVDTTCLYAAGAEEIAVFSTDATLMMRVEGENVCLDTLPHGTYIARVIFDKQAISIKFVR